MKEKGGCNDMKNCSNAFYGIGFIGALVYFIQQASNFGEGVLGVLKAIVWPGFAVYELLKFLQV